MDRCPLCPGIHSCIPADNPGCDIVFIGEAPGGNEDRYKRVFISKTGREVNEHYLPLAGLRRGSVTVTNAIKCLPPGPKGKVSLDRQKDVDLLMSCANTHLYEEIKSAKLIVPMGAFACYAIDPEINLELQHGIPLDTSWGTVFPMYNPAGGVHEPKKMLLIRNDWHRLGKYIKGKLNLPVDQFPDPDYRVVNVAERRGQNSLNDMGWRCNDYIPLACDTEITRQHEPFCLTYSYRPGQAQLIKASDKDTLIVFQTILDRWKGPILWHNWLGVDEQACRDMGLRMPQKQIVDTMVRCYHLGNLPQGLKALSYRLLGVRMMDFDDLVTPYSIPLCLKYLRDVYDEEWPKPEPELVRDDQGKWKLYKPQGIGAKVKRFYTDYEHNPNIDVFARWAKWDNVHQIIQDKLGPWPGKDIQYAPFDKVIPYACGDADKLLRIWPILESMTRDVRKGPQENWGQRCA